MDTHQPATNASQWRRVSTIAQRLSLLIEAAALVSNDGTMQMAVRSVAVSLRLIACGLELMAERDRAGRPNAP